MADRKKAQKSEDFSNAVMNRAAILAAAGISQRKIAQELGVSEYQVSRWAQTAEYIATKNLVMVEAIDVASARLRALAASAVDVLQAAMEDPKSSPADRIRAASAILDRVVGSCGAESIGPTDASVIETSLIAKQQRRELDRSLAEMFGA